MKVLQIYKDYYPPVMGGIENHINLLSRGLKERGLGVEVLVSNTRASLERVEVNGVPVTKVPEFGRLASAPVNISFPFWLKRLGKDADILHFHFPNPTGELSYLLSGLNRKVVVTYHSDIVRQARLGKLYQPFLIRFLEKVKVIIATSPHYVASSKMLGQFQPKCRVIPLGIDLARFSPQGEGTVHVEAIRSRHGSRIVLFVGKLRYYKGLHVLIEAMKRVEGRLLLIGSGPLERDLRTQVTEAGLNRKIFFLGELLDGDLVHYFQACEVFVLPAVLRSEAFGTVLLEAMACGKPVVSTELGTGTSFVNQHRETGLVVQASDPQALAEALTYLLDHPEVGRRYGSAGRERVEEYFSGENMIDRIVETYQDLIGEQGEDGRGKSARALGWL
jgi:glycosyltransferase involved in cell wall biosynthesis